MVGWVGGGFGWVGEFLGGWVVGGLCVGGWACGRANGRVGRRANGRAGRQASRQAGMYVGSLRLNIYFLTIYTFDLKLIFNSSDNGN